MSLNIAIDCFLSQLQKLEGFPVRPTNLPIQATCEVRVDSHMTALSYLKDSLSFKDFHGLYSSKASHFYAIYQDSDDFAAMSKVLVVVAWAQSPGRLDSIPVGIAILDERFNKGKRAFGVLGVYVTPFLRGQGIASRMLKQLMGSCSHKYPSRLLAEGRRTVLATALKAAGYTPCDPYKTVSKNYVQITDRFSRLDNFQKS